jgi:asparagine synthase (glutamine-hydrolysing)
VCGIAGVIGRVDHVNQAAVEGMTLRLDHRGPDDKGLWTSDLDADGWGCILGHRRLSILDLSSSAAQPMIHDGTGQALVYNGEIYNHPQLRAELPTPLGSSGDTAVLLELLAREGAGAVDRLRGMFAFACWDPRDRSLTLARDPIGIKPLYLARNPDPNGSWSVAFASELRALLASGLLVHPRVDPAAVASIVWNGYVMGPGTILRGVELVRPATVRRLDARGRTVADRRYWQVPAQGAQPAISREEVAHELEEAVGAHLISDVPVGVFLSSGVDSSAVANLASRHGEVATFTLSFDDAAFDESQSARAIAAAIGTDHHEHRLTGSDVRRTLETAIDTIDQPTFDGLNSAYMAEAVRAAGFSVALVGTGGDELFGGYQSFQQLPRVRRLAQAAWAPAALRRAAAQLVRRAIARRSQTIAPQRRWAKVPELIEQPHDLVMLYQLSYALFVPSFQRELLADDLAPLPSGLPPVLAEELVGDIEGRGALEALSLLEQRCFLGERLLRDSDAASMASSLELRLPLVDHVLTEAVNRLPTDDRYEPVGRKSFLREHALGDLDPALFERPKQGFELPYDGWLRGDLRETVGAVLTDAAACERVGLDPDAVRRLWTAFQGNEPGLYWTRVWAIYVLLAWTTRHGVSL